MFLMLRKRLLLPAILLVLLMVGSGCGKKDVQPSTTGTSNVQSQNVQPQIEYTELQEIEMPWSPVKKEDDGLKIQRDYIIDKVIVYPKNKEKEAVAVSSDGSIGGDIDTTELRDEYRYVDKKLLLLDENRYVAYTKADDAPSGMFGYVKTLTLVDTKIGTKKKLATKEAVVTWPNELIGAVDMGNEKYVLWLEKRLGNDECDHLYICGYGLESNKMYEFHIAKGFYSGELLIGDSRVVNDQIWLFYANNSPKDSYGRQKGSETLILVMQLKESGFEKIAQKIVLYGADRAVLLPDPEQKGVLFCSVEVNRDNPQLREWRHSVKFGRYELKK